MRDLYRYVADSNRFHAITARLEDRELVALGSCKPFGKKWRAISAVPDYRKQVRWGEFPSLTCPAPVMTVRAWNALEDLIGGQTEPLPLEHPREPLVVVNVLCLVDCLDRKASELSGSSRSEKRVSSISRYAFKTGRLKSGRLPDDVHMFKLPETQHLDVLVSGEFARRVEECGLRGLALRHVGQIRSSGLGTV